VGVKKKAKQPPPAKRPVSPPPSAPRSDEGADSYPLAAQAMRHDDQVVHEGHGATWTMPIERHPSDVSVYFDDESFVTYEGSRIPWWVRLMWIGFWLLVFYYVVTYLVPDAQRYFGM